MMRKESFQGILLGIVIMCAVFAFITIAWAGFSSTLTINGTATVSAQKWQIEFTNSPDTSLGASALPAAVANTHSVGTATLESVSTDQFKLTSNAVAGVASAGSGSNKKLGILKQSGDKIYYQWYVQNFGTFRADIAFSGVTSAANAGGGNIALTCTKTTDSSSETTLCNNDIVAKLYVSDYVDVTSGSYDPTVGSLGTLVLSGTTGIYVPAATTSDNTDVKLVTLVIEFNETTPGTSVVSNDELAITMGDITLTATQHTGS